MLTVMFATCNGERTLPTVLEAYERLTAPDGGWKLVVIENGSVDRTSEILRQFKPSFPVTLLHVEAPGKNRALNAGLNARAGDLVVFTDDDAVPQSNWLVELRRAADTNPEFDIFGGAIKPRWDRPPEPWLLNWVPHSVTYAVTDPTCAEGPIMAVCAWGPNMAVRARLFDEGHRFDERIGPENGVNYAMGSETEFTKRLELLGCRTWFAPTAIVEHIVRSFQMERSWVLRRAVRFGRGLYYLEPLEESPPPAMLFGLPRYRVRRLVEHGLRLTAAKLSGSGEKAFRAAWDLRCEWGYLREVSKVREGHAEKMSIRVPDG